METYNPVSPPSMPQKEGWRLAHTQRSGIEGGYNRSSHDSTQKDQSRIRMLTKEAVGPGEFYQPRDRPEGLIPSAEGLGLTETLLWHW